MDLLTYEDARRYARRIREQVSNELMPPYAYDRDIGIQQLEHDWRLSPEQISTIVSWVDQGAPLGNPADMPELEPIVDTDEWRFTPEFGLGANATRSSRATWWKWAFGCGPRITSTSTSRTWPSTASARARW